VPAEAFAVEDGVMTSAAQLARFAGLLADETRASFCLALIDGRAWTAGEPARHAGVAPSTATEHLHRLIDGGLLVEHRQGRHRYVRLAGPSVAALLEDLTAHLKPAPPARSLRAATVSAALARARTCYDHFAGRLGVGIADAMTRRGYLADGVALTEAGRQWLTGDLGAILDGGRPITRACLDWTERRPHLAGLAGARICGYALAEGWVQRIGSSRAVKVTPSGERAFAKHLGLAWEV
jgi:DNA-binding transcriptional ArsR family regulator